MVNAMMMALYAFAAVLVIWILAGYNFGFGTSSLLKIDGYYIFGIPSPSGAGSFISGQAVVGPLKDRLTIPNSTVMFFNLYLLPLHLYYCLVEF